MELPNLTKLSICLLYVVNYYVNMYDVVRPTVQGVGPLRPSEITVTLLSWNNHLLTLQLQFGCYMKSHIKESRSTKMLSKYYQEYLLRLSTRYALSIFPFIKYLSISLFTTSLGISFARESFKCVGFQINSKQRCMLRKMFLEISWKFCHISLANWCRKNSVL